MTRATEQRDAQLRAALLSGINDARVAPMGGINGAALAAAVASGYVRELSFEDDDHAVRLIRDLVSKGLVAEKALRRMPHESFGPRHLFLVITDKGGRLLRGQIAADPDIFDPLAEEL